jgi:hypothetical protein
MNILDRGKLSNRRSGNTEDADAQCGSGLDVTRAAELFETERALRVCVSHREGFRFGGKI